ncbi:protein Wiz isoform X2 [Neoarius graeffei]|uniref:protein Wiz isoform X2 n=1 Tax=Neoarius graeffei TaxID=443677 RepID=UPI00298CB038|nr:protein Wiz isoform X2 [Neoarius graeffei]
MEKGGVVEKGGVMEKGGVVEKGGVMEKGGVVEKGGVMEKGGVVEKGGVMEKGGVVEKGGEMVRKSDTEFPVSEQQTGDDEAELAMHLCEVCGTCFETRRGLSSHARSHLRQLGVCVSESSGAPISLLYELITERDGALPFTPKHSHSTTATHTKLQTKHGSKHGAKHGSGTKLKIKIGELVKRQCVPVPASLKDDSSSSSSPSSSPLHHHKPPKTPPILPALSKPLGAPQETDTCLDLMDISGVSHRDCVHVCELCGVWYETKKGLTSHARAHLRHFGVELDPKAPPIQVLHDLLQKEVGPMGQDPEEPIGQDLPMGLLTPPPVKKKKKVSLPREKTHRDSGSSKTANCEFCGENFKKTQSLASHARSHLRQLGVTNWTAHGSPMATLRELMARRSCSSIPQPTQTTPLTQAEPPSEAPPLPASGPSQLPKLPSEAPPLPAPGPSPSQLPKPQSEAPPLPALGPSPVRVPKARKGSRLVVSRLKDELVELDISTGKSTKTKITPPIQLNLTTVQSAADQTTVPANRNLMTGPQVEVSVTEPVRCDYCGDLFDSRKALSCHARAHLRQLGVKWAPFASPIDTLYELMVREGRWQGSEATPSPVDFCREKTETDGASSDADRRRRWIAAINRKDWQPSAYQRLCSDHFVGVCEATCELCGFDFENRKALASHARAHLRQQGEQWSSSQSPIVALSQWMSREPEKVAALHQLYMQGTLPHIRKRRVCSPVRAYGANSARSGVSRPSPAARQGKTGPGLSCSSSSYRKLSSHRPTPHSAVEHGSERRPPKLFPLRMEGMSMKRVGNAPSLVPRPPETSLVKLVGKIYSLKCRFCEQVFSGPLSVQEDWLIHLRQHILNLKPDHARSSAPILPHSESAQLIGQAV